MNTLAKAIDGHYQQLRARVDEDAPDNLASDTMELVCVLQRILRGKPVLKAFGAPGDWGYETPIGSALWEELKSAEPEPNRWTKPEPWHDCETDPEDLPDDEILVLAYANDDSHYLAYRNDGEWFNSGIDEIISEQVLRWQHLA